LTEVSQEFDFLQTNSWPFLRYNAVLGGGVLANKSTQDRLRDYAKMGAALRASELQAEINEIYRAFPELKLKKKGASGGASNGASRAAAEASAPAKATKRRTAPKWSAAARRAVSQRMKKYWAERRRAG
jgi:hypothetical protein